MEILCVIPARGGSKGIPGKNLKPLHGRPLLAWTAEVALQAKFTRTILSTDCEEIAAEGRRLGLQVPFLRPADLATDGAEMCGVVNHAIRSDPRRYDYVCVLQPTNPLRHIDDITACLQIAEERQPESVISITPVADHPWETCTLDSRHRVRWNAPPQLEFTTRQCQPPAYIRDGGVYLTRPQIVIEQRRLLGSWVVAYVVPRWRSVRINTPEDWVLAEERLPQVHDVAKIERASGKPRASRTRRKKTKKRSRNG